LKNKYNLLLRKKEKMFGRLPLPFPPSQAARDKKAQLDEA
jgi:hypothetical protein